MPGPLGGQSSGLDQNRHFSVGSARNIPDITLPRLLNWWFLPPAVALWNLAAA
jgi:hypothetical protein